MDLAGLTAPPPSALAALAALTGIVEAVIATTPGSITDEVYVLIGNETQQTGPCRWTPRDGATPARGAACMVQQAAAGHYVVVWWDGVGLTINVRDYGATGLGLVNESAALQAAFDAAGAAIVAGNPGQTVVIPPGVYRYTTAISVPPGVSALGVGRSTVLKPEGCDGLVFQVSDYIGPQRFSMFYIQGDATYLYTAVKALGDADAGRIQGVTFADVFVSNFKTGFHLRSTHGWHLDHVVGIFLWEGVRVVGQTILITIDGGSEFSRDSATGSGESRGLIVASAFDYNPSGTSERGPEGIRVRDTVFFGFSVGVDHVLGLDTVYSGLTLGLVGNTGMRITRANGGFRFRDSWIAYDDGAVYGIYAATLASVDDGALIIEGIHAGPELGKVTNVNSIGCTIQQNHTNITIRDSTWTGHRLHDIRLDFAGKVKLDGNDCRSATAGASIQLVAFPGGPYILGDNPVANTINEYASNTDRTIASAGTLTVPLGVPFVNVTGTTTITQINPRAPGFRVTLKFAAALTLTDGANLFLAGNFVTTADDTITLISDGANWHETSRSVN